MKYKLIERRNPANPEAAPKWYASPQLSGKTTQASISKEIAGRSSLTKGDVSNVIMNLIDELPASLLEGNSVKLDGFGTFRISFSSEGAATQAKFNTSMINKAKIIFSPSSELKKLLLDLSFEKI